MCSIVEKNFRIHLIPMRHFYGVQFLNKSVACNNSPVVSVSRRNTSIRTASRSFKNATRTIRTTTTRTISTDATKPPGQLIEPSEP